MARGLEAAKAAGEEIIIVSDTTGFDAQWLSVYLARAGYDALETLLGQYRPLRDTNSFYFGVGRKMHKWGSEGVALEALGARPHRAARLGQTLRSQPRPAVRRQRDCGRRSFWRSSPLNRRKPTEIQQAADACALSTLAN